MNAPLTLAASANMPTNSVVTTRADRDLSFYQELEKDTLYTRAACEVTYDALEAVVSDNDDEDQAQYRATLAAGARCIRRVMTAWNKCPGIDGTTPSGGVITVNDYYMTAKSAVRPNDGNNSLEWRVGEILAKAINMGLNLPAEEAGQLLDGIVVAAKQVWSKWFEILAGEPDEDHGDEIASEDEAEPMQYFVNSQTDSAVIHEGPQTDGNPTSKTELKVQKAKLNVPKAATELALLSNPFSDDDKLNRNTRVNSQPRSTIQPQTQSATHVTGKGTRWLQDEEKILKDIYTKQPKLTVAALYTALNTQLSNTAFCGSGPPAGKPMNVKYRIQFVQHDPNNIHNAKARKLDIAFRSFASVELHVEQEFSREERALRSSGRVIQSWQSTAKPNLAEHLPSRTAQFLLKFGNAMDGTSDNQDRRSPPHALDGGEAAMTDAMHHESKVSAFASPHNGKTGRAAGYLHMGFTTVNDPAGPQPFTTTPAASTPKKRKGKKSATEPPAKNAPSLSSKVKTLASKPAELTDQTPMAVHSQEYLAMIAKEMVEENEKAGRTITEEEMELLGEIDQSDTPEGTDIEDYGE